MTIAEPISHEDAIARPDSDELAGAGLPFPSFGKIFLMRVPASVLEAKFVSTPNQTREQSVQGQSTVHHDVLVRLPSLREAEWRITVLQRWVGRIEHIGSDKFLAIIEDATNRSNPSEQVEMDIEEVSGSDRALLCEGAGFYWSIGYRDTIGGQRERISSLRLIRQPRLLRPDLDRISAQADELATFLESD